MSIDPSEIQSIIASITSGNAPTSAELQILADALKSGQMTIARGDRAASIGGSADGVVVITGNDNNIVITGAKAELIHDLLAATQQPHKKWLKLLLAFAILLLGYIVMQKIDIPSFESIFKISDSKLAIYENKKYKFRIEYPKNWQSIKEQDTSLGFEKKFISDIKTNNLENCQIQVIVNIDKLPEGLLSLEEYKKMAKTKIQDVTQKLFYLIPG
jgi:hypothetical protein